MLHTHAFIGIHTDYGKSLIPNSWIIALFLQEIKNTWESSQSAITFNEVNSLRQLLSSTYKHYKECITAILETKHFIKFDIVLRATVNIQKFLFNLYDI